MNREAVFLVPGEGRAYAMGRISAIFKADGPETAGRYSISEWWLEPNTQGPGAHSHPEDDVFYVLDGTMSFLVGDLWVDAPAGLFVLAPAGVTHDFENRGSFVPGLSTFRLPATLSSMSEIADWFTNNPPGPAGG